MVPITSAAKPTLAICGQDLPKEMVVRIIERLDRSSMLAFLSANRWLRNSFSEEVLRLRIVRIVAPPGGPSKHAEKLSEVQCALADLRAQQQNVSPQAFEDLLLQLIPTLMFLTATERGPLIRGMLDAGEALPGGLPESIICVLGEVLLCLKVDDEDAHRKRLKSACEQLLEERREMVRLTWEVRDLRVQQQGRTYELPGFKRLLEKLETRQDKLRLPLLKKAIHLLAWELWMDKVRDQVVAIAERASTPDERGELLLTLGQVMVNTLSTQFDPVYGTGDAMRASGEAIGEQLPKLLPAAKGLSPAHTLGFQVAMCQLLLWSTISPVPSQYWLQLLEHVQNNRVDGQIAVLRGLLYCFGAGVLEVDNAALQGELADLLLLYAALETHPADVKAAPLALALLCQVPFPAQRMQELCSHFCSVIDNLGKNMGWLITKYLVTAGVVVAVSEFAKRSDRLGSLVASLPLVTVMALIWLYVEKQPEQKLANHAWYTFWYVVPTLPMFLAFPGLLHRFGFWPALLACIVITMVAFAGFAWLVRGIGVDLL